MFEIVLVVYSKGVGQFIVVVLWVGVVWIVVGLGGSVCIDGGKGMIVEFGGLDVVC